MNCHFCFNGYTASLVGIGDSSIGNLNQLLHLLLPFVQPQINNKLWQIKDIKIVNVPVRIYTPTHLFNDATKKLTGVVYLHGGGWTMGSVGKCPKLFRL